MNPNPNPTPTPDPFPRLRWHHLTRWAGEIDRGTFLLWGLLLFILKFNLDRLLVRLAFDRDWSVTRYFAPSAAADPGAAPPGRSEIGEWLALLAVAIPFLAAGVLLCVKRLRHARLPLWLAVLFVVPGLKWLLFAALGLLPARAAVEANATVPGVPPAWVPTSRFVSAGVAVLGSALLAVLGVAIGAATLQQYGWGLFAGVPFAMGFLAALLYGAGARRTATESLGVALLAVTLSGGVILAVALEGAICLVMAAPLAYLLAALGAMFGHLLHEARWRLDQRRLCCVPLLALPLMLLGDVARPEPPPLLRVVTAVEVDAPVETVWRHVVSFTELPPPREAIFKLGIAYPLRAEINGRGPGAVRHCVFSTGPFVEPIEVWDEPRLLRFSVTENPAPMEEWTPYRAIHPPHLRGFLMSRQGQFRLTPLPGGRTRLEGTTWYQHGLWPALYWRLWSDRIIHTIHRRVLRHVKQLSESEAHP